MSITVASPPAHSGSSEGLKFTMRPGFLERAGIVFMIYITLHDLPNLWFSTRSELLVSDGGNPALVATQVLLILLALMRVAGSLNLVSLTMRLEPALGAFASFAFISLFWSADLYSTTKDSILLLGFTVYAGYLVIRLALNEILRLLALMFVLSAATNLVFMGAFYRFAQTEDGWDGVFAQKNALGFAATMAIPTLLIVAREHRRFRVAYYSAAAGHFALLLGSQSKTMLVATIGSSLLIPVYRSFRARKTLRGAVIFSLGSTSALTLAFATANVAYLSELLGKDVTLTGRTLLWEDLVPVFFERPFFGFGFGAAFGGYFSPIHEVWIQNRWTPSHAHNALLQTGLELGLVGVAIFVFLVVRSISRAIRVTRIEPGIVGVWPLVFFSTTLLISISESGVASNDLGWLMFSIAVLSVGARVRQRDLTPLPRDYSSASKAPMSGVEPRLAPS